MIFLTSSAEAIDASLMLKIFLILFNEAFLSPAIKHKIKKFSVLKSKLLTIAPTSQPKDKAASEAVLAYVFKTMTFWFGSNSFNNLSTLCTGSLFNKVIIQPLIVSYFIHLIIQLCENCIGVIN